MGFNFHEKLSAPRVSTDKHLCLRQTAWRREGRLGHATSIAVGFKMSTSSLRPAVVLKASREHRIASFQLLNPLFRLPLASGSLETVFGPLLFFGFRTL